MHSANSTTVRKIAASIEIVMSHLFLEVVIGVQSASRAPLLPLPVAGGELLVAVVAVERATATEAGRLFVPVKYREA
jgi:hypothetical protein